MLRKTKNMLIKNIRLHIIFVLKKSKNALGSTEKKKNFLKALAPLVELQQLQQLQFVLFSFSNIIQNFYLFRFKKVWYFQKAMRITTRTSLNNSGNYLSGILVNYPKKYIRSNTTDQVHLSFKNEKNLRAASLR